MSDLDVSRVLIAVSTCERPTTSNIYLWKTLRSLAVSGLTEISATKVVFSDGPICSTKSPPDDFLIVGDINSSQITEKLNLGPDPTDHSRDVTIEWELHDTSVRRGARENLWRALRLATANPGIDRLLFFEDDIKCLGKNALLRMISCPFHETDAFISFFDMKELPYGTSPGLHSIPITGVEGNGFWGLQAVAFPRRTFERLATRDPWAIYTDIPAGASDRVLETYVDETPWQRYSIHSPSLVAHVGHDSAVDPGQPLGGRFSKNPASDEHDGRSYFGRGENRYYWRKWGKGEVWNP